MFDIAWSEMLVIGAVALIAIGPKDLPKALRAVGAMTAKARRMATEFQDHFREAMREAELESIKQEVANIHQDLNAATTGMSSEVNAMGAQMPSPSEVQPPLMTEAPKAEPPTIAAPEIETRQMPAVETSDAGGAGKLELSAAASGAPTASTPTALGAAASPEGVAVKPARKKRSAAPGSAKAKAATTAPDQAALALNGDASGVPAPKAQRKRTAKPPSAAKVLAVDKPLPADGPAASAATPADGRPAGGEAPAADSLASRNDHAA